MSQSRPITYEEAIRALNSLMRVNKAKEEAFKNRPMRPSEKAMTLSNLVFERQALQLAIDVLQAKVRGDLITRS